MIKSISTISLNAPVNKIWDALTKPELVKQWQYGSDLITDWKVGSGIRFRSEWEGQIFEQWGKILEVTPYKLIRYSLFAPRPDLEDIPANNFVMNYILTEEKNSIRLDIVQEDSRPGAVQEAPQGEENPVMGALKALIES
ncbi:MAG: SRPBCC domain-containing protein [Bacteroidales bacterium]|nr:SRPBCC domain-containing protein [Bacteroidales bacterium]